jgi:hypothetical protein
MVTTLPALVTALDTEKKGGTCRNQSPEVKEKQQAQAIGAIPGRIQIQLNSRNWNRKKNPHRFQRVSGGGY